MAMPLALVVAGVTAEQFSTGLQNGECCCCTVKLVCAECVRLDLSTMLFNNLPQDWAR